MEAEGPGLVLTILSFVIGFSALVFIHEWGHYSVARLFNVRVQSFSIGFGREVFGWTSKAGVRWKFCLLPLGGYVKFWGDASAASNPASADLSNIPVEQRDVCFHFKPVWQRMLIVAAGPVINLVAAVLVFAAFFYGYGMLVSEPVIDTVVEQSPAEAAGFQEGDRITAVAGKKIERFGDIRPIIQLYPGKTMTVTVERFGETLILEPTLGTDWLEDRFGNKYPYGVLGISSGTVQRYEPGLIESVNEGSKQTLSLIRSIFTTLGQMIMGVRSVDELGGPIRIVNMTGEAAERGVQDLVWFLALISVNLGVINLLPIPVLDGGHLLFYMVEMVKGSPLSKKAQEAGFMAGFALMLLFMVYVTLNDLQSMAL